MAGTTEQPTPIRQLDTPAAHALADLASIFEELQTVLRCCERLVDELGDPSREPDDLVLEAVWATAVLSYTRCFASDIDGTRLTEDDVSSTQLQGEVLEWHKVLQHMREHYADPVRNPRERFAVGAAQNSRGQVDGIAITSARQPPLDDLTVRQTGALAYELSRLVDQRIAEQQEHVRAAASTMSTTDLDQLPRMDVTTPDDGDPATRD